MGGVGPPSPLFARGSAVVDFFGNRPCPPSLTRRLACGLLGLDPRRTRSRALLRRLQRRSRRRAARAFLARAAPLLTLPRVVNGSPPFERHDYALALMRVYTPEALPRLLASFQTPDATLARAWAQITSPAATAAERVQQLISQRQILDEEDRRPSASLPSPAAAAASRGGAKGIAALSGWSAPVSFSGASACFVDAHRTALRRWLDLPIVSAPLACHTAAANVVPSIDE